jgi:glycosyltransferase involved in cell wall biosynthesis
MRLAYDATALLGPRTGVGVFTAEVLARLAERPGLDVVAYGVTWRGRTGLASELPPGVGLARRPMAARPLRLGWSRTDLPPIEWWTGAVDVVHGPNFVVPPSRRAAAVVTVHDLACVRFPELCTRDTLEYPGLIRRAIRRGATVHTVSQFVADEVVATFAIEPERVVVIPNGVVAPDPHVDGRADPTTPTGLAPGGRFVLALGTVEPRKDLPLLVRAFDLRAEHDPELRLVIAGPDGWGAAALTEAVSASHHRSRIVRTGWVDDHRREALLREASVYAFPSRYEGFGLPPLEAMAKGTPVVATRVGALPEVLGDAAVFVAPQDAEALAAALGQVLDDEEYTATLVARGRRQADHYSWDTTTERLSSLYAELAASGS